MSREFRGQRRTRPQSPTKDAAPTEGSASEDDLPEREGKERRDDPEDYARQRRLVACRIEIHRAVISGSKPSPATEKPFFPDTSPDRWQNTRGADVTLHGSLLCQVDDKGREPCPLLTGLLLGMRRGPTNRPGTGVPVRPCYEE